MSTHWGFSLGIDRKTAHRRIRISGVKSPFAALPSIMREGLLSTQAVVASSPEQKWNYDAGTRICHGVLH